ncbi:MAG: efflux RND transporter periplasmic adaptor subunit [Synechococcus sp.]
MTLQHASPELPQPEQLELFSTAPLHKQVKPSVPRRRWNRWAIALVPIAVVAGGAIAARTNAVSTADIPPATSIVRALPVETIEVTPTDSYKTQRSYTGDVEARRSSELGFEHGGLVFQMMVEEGDRVKTGQIIAQLDTQRLMAQRQELLAQTAQAKAELAELVKGPRAEDIAAAEANVRDLEAQLELANIRMQRRQQLQQEGAISMEELDEFSSMRHAILARLDAANSQLEELQTGSRSEDIAAQQAAVQSLEARIDTLDVDIAKSELKAPFDGRVAIRHLDEGEVIASGQTVVRLVEDGAMEARIGISVKAASALKIGSERPVVVGDRQYLATVKSLLPELDSPTRTISAILTLPEDAMAVPGEVVRLKLEDRVHQRGYWLPATALVRSDRGLWSTYALSPADRDYTVERQEVEVLETDGNRVFVRGTLQPGDRIVSSGTHRIVVGQRVTPVDRSTMSQLQN